MHDGNEVRPQGIEARQDRSPPALHRSDGDEDRSEPQSEGQEYKGPSQLVPRHAQADLLEEGGNTLVHPTLVGQSLKDKAGPVFAELIKATPEGTWVDYVWQEKQKHTYVRKTSGGLIVGSGYSE